MMEDEEGYTVLNLRPKWGCSGGLSSPGNPGSRQCPGWLQVALGAGNLIQAVAVLLLAVCVSHLVSEKGQTPAAPGSDGARSRDPSTAECSARLERFRSQLCPPAPPGPAGGSGCKLCPTDWQLRGDKCYWVSRGRKTWRESRADCSARGSQLLVIRDPEELEFLKALTQDSNQFWVGLSVPSPEKAWTWLDGSRLDHTQLPVSGWDDRNRCGKLWGNWIQSDTCSSGFPWICQRDAVPL
ncbi:killer cell lectin-like receptor subfamily B member 1 [Mauremys mutica]|uniref:killer cell lectin-like receptor subfamily B member 1 n=1 Tax=Mauremys mutica TaxID=74926 RepID=UPI001D16697F|nr:killer cell lectin-like receptor subfamily B member 1 [Mauremys mutica]